MIVMVTYAHHGYVFTVFLLLEVKDVKSVYSLHQKCPEDIATQEPTMY